MHTRASNSKLVEPLPETVRTLNRRLRQQNRRVSFEQRNAPPAQPKVVYALILDINYFRNFLDIHQNYNLIDDEPMWAVDCVVALALSFVITIPETSNEFAIKETPKLKSSANDVSPITHRKLFAEFDEFIEISTEENSESESESDIEETPFEKITFNTDYKIKTSLEETPLDLELKPLPDNLEYVFLEEPSFLLVIISSQLSEQNKNKLIYGLKQHKQDFAWKTTDILRIGDSPWLSPIHCVPKKGGIIVVTNEKYELVPTRTVTGWRVCIDYRKLYEATAKDHFPLPFMDQMLERLTGNKYFYFLDGFSGYFQIPIEPMDQEKTTFTCPFRTYAYRRMPFDLYNAFATFQRGSYAYFAESGNCLFSSSTKWVIDSGASDHMTVSRITSNLQCNVKLYPEYYVFKDLKTKKIIGRGRKCDGLYVFEPEVSKSLVRLSSSSPFEAHFRLGRPSLQSLKKLCHEYSRLSSLNCDSCEFAKNKHVHLSPRANKQAASLFELVHLDVWGPCPITSKSGFKYFVTFVDDYSHVTWLYLMKNRSEVFTHFRSFVAEIKTQFHVTVYTLRSDNAKEYFLDTFQSYMLQHGILHESSCVYRTAQNGVAERKNRHLLEVAHALLFQMTVPKPFWADVVSAACFLVNCMPYAILGGNYPYLVLFPTKPLFSIDPKIFGNSILVLKTVGEALAYSRWRAAMIEEMNALDHNGTWALVDLPVHKKAIGCKWVFSIKMNPTGSIARLKARLALHQLDVKNAFLHGDLEEEVYMEQPPGFVAQEEFRRTKDLGLLKYFLRIEVSRSRKLCDEPMIPKLKLRSEDERLLHNPEKYRRVVVKLNYVTITRLDIVFSISVVSQFLTAPRTSHWDAVTQILRYLKGTPGLGILYANHGHNIAEGFTDADYAGCHNTSRSTTGYCIFIGGNLVSWKSKKQNVVSQSSSKAEYRAMSQTTCELVWLRNLLGEISFPESKPMKMWCDNQAAIYIATNPVFHERTKHIEVDCHFTSEKLEDGTITTPHIKVN
uniref:Copia protein n=1 Tax=Tanacetum cinerariifolium TaxID=118510 RepID=A0A6L2N0B7_TANCI|nr:copia protein [Tanacetum cinerariifolium]